MPKTKTSSTRKFIGPGITVLIPAFNEALVIRSVLNSLNQEMGKIGQYEIVVIDDGSTDRTAEEATKAGAILIQHLINRGLGGALGTGLRYAQLSDTQVVVTFDADGQHDPRDIARVIKPIVEKRADVVIESRMLKGMNRIPWDRRILITAGNILTRLLFGVTTTDSQSGFRAFSRKAVNKLQVKTQGMEVSSEFFSEIKRLHFQLAEVPIKVIYSRYSREKGQANRNALSIVLKLFLRLSR